MHGALLRKLVPVSEAQYQFASCDFVSKAEPAVPAETFQCRLYPAPSQTMF
jgi:hypothetical protein